MRNQVYKIFEFAYIGFAAFSLYLVYANWNEDRERAYLFAFFTCIFVFMFFFKRNFRRKIEERNKEQ